MKSTTLIMLEEQLKWAYQGSQFLNGRIDWDRVKELKLEIKRLAAYVPPAKFCP